MLSLEIELITFGLNFPPTHLLFLNKDNISLQVLPETAGCCSSHACKYKCYIDWLAMMCIWQRLLYVTCSGLEKC